MALLTGTVTGRFEDIIPGVDNITGKVTFVAEADYLLSADSTVLPLPVTVDLVNSAFSVVLVATDDPTLNPVDWTYRVLFNLPVERASFSIKVPAGTVTDLATVTPVASYAGEPTIVGPQGLQGLTGPQGLTGDDAPFTSLSVIGTVTGPETAGAQGIQGIQGVKGDAGGLVNAVGLGANYDLNNLKTPGTYQTDAATASLVLNHPQAGLAANVLVIASGPSLVTQIAYPLNGALSSRIFWLRAYNTSAWQPWKAYTSSRTDQTAGRAMYQYDELNNREQLIYGDTGSRIISDVIDATKWQGAVAKIRRVGSQVELRLLSLLPQAGVSGSVTVIPGTLPLGFQNQHSFGFTAVDSANLVIGGNMSFGGGPMTLSNVVSGRYYSTILTWQTSNPWPTTLPGTADGSIQNT